MLKNIYLVGAIVAAVVIAGVAWVADRAAQKAPVTQVVETKSQTVPEDLIRFCLRNPSGERVCATRNAVNQRATETLATSLTLNHPSDDTVAPESVSNCAAYKELHREGWYALTSVDQTIESSYIALCGASELSRRVKVPSSSEFPAGILTREKLELIPASDWPVFGEGKNEITPGFIQQEDGLWIAEYGSMIAVISEVAHGDFNEDDAGDMLVYLLASPQDGTARMYEFAIITAEEDTSRLIAIEPFN